MTWKTTQREAVLHRLEQGPATTWDLTVGLHILRPGARIFELRRQGVEITSSEQMLSGKRVVTYRLVPSTGNGDASVSVHERTPAILTCTECRQAFYRSAKARPLLAGELPFCSDAHRAAYHRRQKAIDFVK